MRNKYELNQEQGIKKITLLSSTIIIFIVATIIGSFLIKTEFTNFKNHIKNFEETVLEREKFYIKTAVENLEKDIYFDEVSILNSKKKQIKNQSIIAHNLASSLEKRTKNLSKKEQINLIKNSIKQISQKQNDINYFILDTKGKLILNSENSKDEGENFLDFEDINGVKFIKEMLNAKKDEQKYIEYFWYKPNSSITAKKIIYSQHLKSLDLIIGSGSFIQSKNSDLKNKILQKISSQNFNLQEYVFIYEINSLNNIKTQNKLLVEKQISSNIQELQAIEKLLINTKYKGDDYILYQNNQKILYGTFIEHLRYFIGVGVNLSKIYKIIENEKQISLNNLYSNIYKLIIIITVMTIIFFILSLLFTKKIAQIFSNYKKNVILNEEKYHLLFNHSNDAFIISSISNDKAKIISCNKTATKVTYYTKEELYAKDFFELFINLKELLNKDSFFGTVKLHTKTGEIKTIELNTIIYINDKQKLLFASIRDITERTLLKIEKSKQENILIQKAKMASMGEMIGNIAHQWRQPLSQVSGLFLDIESAYDYKELDKRYLASRVSEANDLLEYMSRTIDDFRDFFNPNSKKEIFTIYDAILNASNIVKKTLLFHEIKLEISVDENLKIDGYKNEYSQAVLNIISNAKDILVEKKIINPKINIFIEQKKKIKLCIEDNAGGVDKEIIDKIFDPYFTTKFEYGTGIGLYMTKLIIEDKMQGSIKVENINKGAKFTIVI